MTDYKQTHGLIMFPLRSILGWFFVSWDFLLYLALQPRFHYLLAPRQLKNHINMLNWPWPQSLTPTFDLYLEANVVSKHDLLLFDLELWPTTLTYNPILAKVNVDPQIKNQRHRSNGSTVRVLTDERMDTPKGIISPALRSIKRRDVWNRTCSRLYVTAVFEHTCA